MSEMHNGKGIDYRRLDWALGIATVMAIAGTLQGRRIGLAVEDVSFLTLVALIVLFVAMAWWRLRRAWREGGMDRRQVYLALAGCAMLSVAFALPLIPFFFWFVLRWGFGPRWDYKVLMFSFGLGASLFGIPAARRVRFPLIAGGLVIALVGLVLPVGV